MFTMQQPYLQSFDLNYINKCYVWCNLYLIKCYTWDMYFLWILTNLKRKVLQLLLGTWALVVTELRKWYTQKISGYVTERHNFCWSKYLSFLSGIVLSDKVYKQNRILYTLKQEIFAAF